MKLLTQEELKNHLIYEPETGIFIRKISNSMRMKIGDVAGGKDKDGYVIIRINTQMHKAHRLAWLYMMGEWPTYTIDHINGIKGDNRIENLREATDSENKQNFRKPSRNNTAGFLGVSFSKKDKKFRASISVDGKQKHLGNFDTAEKASAAYLAAKRIHHKFCTI